MLPRKIMAKLTMTRISTLVLLAETVGNSIQEEGFPAFSALCIAPARSTSQQRSTL